ncbi:class I SAM-dependent methyltransferase [Ectothiorhodospiraceae bacterium WFHF3C12]|nr:class I SAM-dependent methyltransferase [Ectothiorhodospiraceae bacterium WFHF3C12]
MGFYERYILPPLLTCACGSKPIRYQRRKIVPEAEGRVLELGIGPGLNLPFYDPDKVKAVIGVDPSAELRGRAERAARQVSFPVEYLTTTAEDMPLDRHSIDTLVVTFTLCTIPDAVSALYALRPALKPGARVLFCEHGLAPDERVQRFQNRINPLWKRIAGGCNVNRDIPALLEASGYRVKHLETMYLPGTPRFAGFNFWGSAEVA